MEPDRTSRASPYPKAIKVDDRQLPSVSLLLHPRMELRNPVDHEPYMPKTLSQAV